MPGASQNWQTTIGAVILFWRKAATKVIVSHAPSGTMPITLTPLGARPLDPHQVCADRGLVDKHQPGGIKLAILVRGSADVGSDWATAIYGLPRVAFSFFAGVLIASVQPSMPVRLAPWLCLGLQPLLLVAPVSGAARTAFDLACVLVIFPALGACWDPRARALSYGLYVLHAPVLLAVRGGLRFANISMAPMAINLRCLALALVAAWGADLVYDAPVRRWLGGPTPISDRAMHAQAPIK